MYDCISNITVGIRCYWASHWMPPQQNQKVECLLHVWKVVERILDRVRPKTWKWLVVASIVMFHINRYHNNRSAFCLYTVTGWHGIPMWLHIGQSTIAIIRHVLNITSDVKAMLNPNNPLIYGSSSYDQFILLLHLNIIVQFCPFRRSSLMITFKPLIPPKEWQWFT